MAQVREAATIAAHLEHGSAAPSTTSATPAGPDNDTGRDKRIEALNQVFALFRLNYHNQFYSAYPDIDQLSHIKRLWLDALGAYTAEHILKAARYIIEHSTYLPSLKSMLDGCNAVLTDAGVPSPRDAYLEACTQPSPKIEQNWSHPVVYLAGRDSDWFFLSHYPEATTWPTFSTHYQRYLDALSRGQTFTMPERPELPEPETTAMSKDERQQALRDLRLQLGL